MNDIIHGGPLKGHKSQLSSRPPQKWWQTPRRSNSDTLGQKETNGLEHHCSWYFRQVPSELHCRRTGSQTDSRKQDCKVSAISKDTYYSQLPSRQRDHGVSKRLNWCKKLGDASLSSQRTAEKPSSCFRGCPWLCRREMRSHSYTLSRKTSQSLQSLYNC